MEKIYVNLIFALVFGCLIGIIGYYVFIDQKIKEDKPKTNMTIIKTDNQTQIIKFAQIITIKPDCTECISSEGVVGSIKKAFDQINIKYNESILSANSEKAITLINKYDIKFLPTVVVIPNNELNSQFTDAWKTAGSIEKDNSLILRNIFPPYYDVNSKSIKGLVSATAISASNCNECMNASDYFDSLELAQFGVIFKKKEIINETDPKAIQLIEKYQIKKLPTLIIDKEISSYPVVNQINKILSDEGDVFVIRDVYPPYKLINGSDKKIIGRVEAKYITNSSCKECFDPKDLSKYMIQSLGVVILNETTFEITNKSAIELINKYNISSIPAIIYSSDISAYPDFDKLWINESNTIENDGSFVFRAYNFLNATYQNLTK